MKKYMQPELELNVFEVADVITASGDGSYSYGDFGTANSDTWIW